MNDKNLPRTKALSFEHAVKSVTDIGNGEVEGYASIFGNIDQHGEIVERGAFTKTIAERGDKVLFCWQHNKHEIIGKIVELREDQKGLYFRAQFAPTPRGQEARELLKMGALGGFSFGFNVIQEAQERLSNGRPVVRLKQLRLTEISAVSQPCNEEALPLGVKSLDEPEFNDAEMALIEEFKNSIIAQRTADTDEGVSEEPEGIVDQVEPAHPEPITEEQIIAALEEPHSEVIDAEQVKEALQLAFLKEDLRRAFRK